MYIIYWILSERRDKTYVGYSNVLERRLTEHKDKKVKSTINFGKFTYKILDKTNTLQEARIKEKYWKSATGRRKLKKLFDKIN